MRPKRVYVAVCCSGGKGVLQLLEEYVRVMLQWFVLYLRRCRLHTAPVHVAVCCSGYKDVMQSLEKYVAVRWREYYWIARFVFNCVNAVCTLVLRTLQCVAVVAGVCYTDLKSMSRRVCSSGFV